MPITRLLVLLPPVGDLAPLAAVARHLAAPAGVQGDVVAALAAGAVRRHNGLQAGSGGGVVENGVVENVWQADAAANMQGMQAAGDAR